MEPIKPVWKLPLKFWSATDYAYLVNNDLGSISDDERWYEFDSEADMKAFAEGTSYHDFAAP
jgi:hypothetical protein